MTGDEKWVTYVNFRRKRQWVGPGQTPIPDVKPDTHQKKIMLCVFWDIEGVVHWELLDAGTTLTAAIYSQQLEKVAVALRQKRPLKSKVILQMDNARPHVAKLTRSKIHDLGWEILPHPPYSPDLAPSDYYLFRTLNNEIGGQQFDSDDALKTWLTNFFASKPKVFYERGIRKLPVKWADVVHHNGNYNE